MGAVREWARARERRGGYIYGMQSRIKTYLLAAGALLSISALAQDDPAAADPTADVMTAPTASDFAESHLAAAAELLEVIDMEATLEKSIDATLAIQMAQMPQMAAVEDVMRDFFTKYMSYEVLEDDYALLYADAYSEEDLIALTEFYRTPLGQRVVAATPDITAAGMELGQRATAEHMPELQQAIMAKMSGGGNN